MSADKWLPPDEWDREICQHCHALIDYLRERYGAELLAVGLNNVKAPERMSFVSVVFDEALLADVTERFEGFTIYERRAFVCRPCYCSVDSAFEPAPRQRSGTDK